ncbi:MAG: pilin [Firmicutes bacterium]|nr:pilin [Bacillota bacterium]
MKMFLAKFNMFQLAAAGGVGDAGVNPFENMEWLLTLTQVVNSITLILMIAVGMGGTVYAVILGVNLARAEDAERREEAKKRLIWALVGIGAIFVLIVLINIAFGNPDVDAMGNIVPGSAGFLINWIIGNNQ